MSEPATAAGRAKAALIARMTRNAETVFGPMPDDQFIRALDAIEAEARAAALDGLPDALAVVFAYNESNASVAPNGSVEFGGEPTSYWRDRAEAVIDALRERSGE